MTDRSHSQYALRPLEKADIAVVSRWFLDVEDLASFDRAQRVPTNLTSTEVNWEPAIGSLSETGNCWFAVESSARQIVGIIGLEAVSSINRDAIIPLFIEKSARRRGVGIRATALMLDLAFRQLGLNRVTSYYRDDNERSRDLTSRVGFEVEGKMRQAWFAEGKFFDMVAVGILRDEWLDRRKDLATELCTETVVTFGGMASPDWAWPPTGS